MVLQLIDAITHYKIHYINNVNILNIDS